MKLLRLAALAAGVLLAACTSSPTSSARPDAVGPNFNGGSTLGSGNYAGDGTGNTVVEIGLSGSGDDGQFLASDSTGTASGSERGGGGLGSGN